MLALYANGQHWNDYILADGTTALNATGAPCAATLDGGSPACWHAGELRAFTVTGRTSCNGLTAADDLGAFDWICDDSVNPVRVVSTGLKPSRGLADLIDFSPTTPTWRANVVRVSDGSGQIAASASGVWWGNPVRALGVLTIGMEPSVIWAAKADGGSYTGATLAAPKSALVTEPIDPTDPRTLAVTASGQNYLWLEGFFRTPSSGDSIRLSNTSHSTVRRATSLSSFAYGLSVTNAPRLRVSQVTIRNSNPGSGAGAISLVAVPHLLAEDLEVDGRNTATAGVSIEGPQNGLIRRVRLHRSAIGLAEYVSTTSSYSTRGARLLDVVSDQGVSVFGQGNLVVKGVRLSNAALSISGSGVSASDIVGANTGTASGVNEYVVRAEGQNHTISNVTAINSRGVYPIGNSIWVSDVTVINASVQQSFAFAHGSIQGDDLSFYRNAVANQDFTGFALDATFQRITGTTVRDLAVAHSGENAIRVVGGNGSNHQFNGLIMVGNSARPSTTAITDCFVQSNVRDAGIASNNTMTTNCRLLPSSTGTIIAPISMGASFVGKVTTDDPANASDSNGQAAFSSISDWVNFANPYRGWGKDGAMPFPHDSNTGNCVTGQNCRIWDASLVTGDAILRNRLQVPNANSVFTQRWVGDGGTCMEVPGAAWNGTVCASTALNNSRELIDDGVGNDNLLCESNETCLFTPNIGSYQGHGALQPAGTVTGGVISNVTLLQHQTNGR